ncbi:pyridine nucleotide-disulfide oxidoreductase [Streptomyces chrestomyceticus JCM 4735]|uniref:Pyridine nucleotide-disulfide oxidoreductase n=1 Tax=Streptomyces chrestomyceticus JCM 4735 TaxID=1306181 RepID=A0A7U9KQ05_9ACTN|nr:FAD-dependent oxidoreductase [Streptomyces chrestomyceticus]GCD33315.1 pyridine nucleotide-disulfide oxidoreductase [Streptomyces chrestomyceticus JCM 4735]
MTPRRIAVVGASAAGLAAAEALRRFGWTGTLTLVGDEPHPPYDRPPLSKQLLQGAWQPDKLHLRAADQLDTLALDLRLGTRATGLDTATRTLTLDSGERLACDGVIVATGVAARTLPDAAGLDGVLTLRTLEDALALKERLSGTDRRLVVVGNGVLGCEAAAVARELGHQVTLVGREALPMARTVGPQIGELLAAEHQEHGVHLRTAAVDGFEADGDGPARHVTAVRLADGTRLPADTVLVAIGSEPAVGWLRGDPALDTADGLRCDAYCAAAPGIYAAGDVARWQHPVHGRHLRVEHRMNATEQGMAAARNLLAELEETLPEGGDGALAPAAGRERRPFTPVPYFWSDQYGLKIQAYGVLNGADRSEATVLDPDARKAVALYGRDGQATGILAIGVPPRQTRGLRALIATPAPWEEAREGVRNALA